MTIVMQICMIAVPRHMDLRQQPSTDAAKALHEHVHNLHINERAAAGGLGRT